MPKLSYAQRVLRSQIANDERWSRVAPGDRAIHTQAARDASFQRYLDKVDPDGTLDEDTRYALARQARRADMRRMALAASKRRTAEAAADEVPQDEDVA